MDNFLSTAEFNLSEFLRFGEVDFRIFTIMGIQSPPEGGAALDPLIPLVTLISQDGEEFPLIMVPLLSLGAGLEFSLISL